MSKAPRLQGIGIFGGTFDPVHVGHLRTAIELRDALSLAEIHLLPCGDPPHRDVPLASARHRLAMLQLGIAGEPGLEADSRELERQGPSYTLDTLAAFRGERGPDEPLYLCIGMDSLVTLDTWHRWRELVDYAHIAVCARPGWELPARGEVAEWLRGRQVDRVEAVRQQPSGRVIVIPTRQFPIAATGLRNDLARGRSIRYLTPDSVIGYIEEHQLYQRENT